MNDQEFTKRLAAVLSGDLANQSVALQELCHDVAVAAKEGVGEWHVRQVMLTIYSSLIAQGTPGSTTAACGVLKNIVGDSVNTHTRMVAELLSVLDLHGSTCDANVDLSEEREVLLRAKDLVRRLPLKMKI